MRATVGACLAKRPWQVNVRILIHGVIALASVSLAQARECQGMSDDKIRQAIVQESRMAYFRLGYPCACPYDLARNGQECGRRSAYSRPGGASPKCYVSDITVTDTRSYCRPLDQN
jgi:hypothetical protein